MTGLYALRDGMWVPLLGGDSVTPGDAPPPATITHGSQLNSSNTGPQGGLFDAAFSGNIYTNKTWLNNNNGGSQVIQNKHITACGFAAGAGVSTLTAGLDGFKTLTFQNCYFSGVGQTNGGVWFNTDLSGDSVPSDFRLVIQNCLFDGLGLVTDAIEEVVISGLQWSMTRCEIRNICGTTRNYSGHWSMSECYVHSLATLSPSASPHSSVVGILQGDDITIDKCKLWTCNESGVEGPNIGATAAIDILARQQGDSDTITITDCDIQGGGYAIYCGGSGSFDITNLTVSGLIVERMAWAKGGQFGPCNSFDNSGSESSNVWSNNVWGALGPHNLGGDPAAGVQIPAA